MSTMLDTYRKFLHYVFVITLHFPQEAMIVAALKFETEYNMTWQWRTCHHIRIESKRRMRSDSLTR
jgi:hypothetical protein